MQGLIDRMGVALFIQIVIEVWNCLFLFIMIFSLMGGKKVYSGDSSKSISVPFTPEIIIFYNAIFIYNVVNITGIIADGHTGTLAYFTTRISDFLYYAIGAFQTLFFLELIKRYVPDKSGSGRLKKVTFILQLLHIPSLILLLITPATGVLYYFTENNEYERGKLFYFWHIGTILMFLYIFVISLEYRKKIHPFLRQINFSATIIPFCGFILNTNSSGISFNNISVTVTALAIFMFYEKHRTLVAVQSSHELDMIRTELAEKQLALEQSKNEVLISQIQPHFINNTLMAIRSECRDEPDLYRNITNFSKYLRSHFSAISGMQMITFEREMDNIESYLELERENFGERLEVEYDIERDDFLVPALSVQPLVENAVRHGIGTYENGGTVYIEVHCQEDKTVIVISDKGSGECNITPQQIRRRDMGIEYVRSRLRAMGNAELEITKSETGTASRITISE